MDEGPSNPMEGSIWAQTFFCWLLPLFKYGYKHPLEMPDLHKLCDEDRADILAENLESSIFSEFCRYFAAFSSTKFKEKSAACLQVQREGNWQKQLQAWDNCQKKPSLLRALIKTFWRPLAIGGIIVFIEECIFKLLQPVLLSYLVTYFSPDPGITTRQAYLCALGMVFCGGMAVVMHHPFFFRMSRLGMQIRIALSSMIFRKSLRLSNSALGQITIGKLVNILSSDVNRFDLVMLFLHYVWIGPTQLLVLLIILYRNMGPSCLSGFVILILLAPLQGWMGKMFSKFRNLTAILTDERVRIMNEIISGMRIIKIHAWESPFSQLVEGARKKEIGKIRRSSFLRAFNLAFFSMATTIISFATFTVYAFSGHVLTPSIVFLAIPLFNAVRLTVVLFIPFCIMYGSEGLIAIKRIQEFLMMEELKSLKRSASLSSIASDGNLPVPEQIGEPLEEVDNNPDIEMEESKANSVVDGDIAIQFLPLENGTQENSKLVNETGHNLKMDKKNFDESIDNRKGDEKMKECEEKDEGMANLPLVGRERNPNVIIRNLSGSWDAVTGEGMGFELRDINLSVKAGELVAVIGPVGSGKSSLLMAIMNELPTQTGEVSLSGSLSYTAQQPWVFSGTLRDNILFGSPFEEKKYKRVLSVCALMTDISLFADGDLTLVGDRGVTLSGGQRARVGLARAVYHDADVFLLDDPLSAVDTAVGRHLFDKCIKGHLRKKPVILVTHQLQYLSAADRIVVLKEGDVVACGSYEELQTSGIDFVTLLKEYEEEEKAKDSMSRTSSVCSIPASLVSEIASLAGDIELEKDEKGSQRLRETKAVGSIGYFVYMAYFKAGAGVLGFLVFMLCNCSAQAFFTLTDWWLAQWSFAEETACIGVLNGSCIINTVQSNHTFVDELDVDRYYYLNILSIFLCCFVVLSFLRTFQLFAILINASKHLHNQMFSAIIRAPMQFFDTNPLGRVLNRFSKDLSFMDEMLPTTFVDFNTISIQTLGIIITIGIFNPIVFIFTIPLCLAFIMVRRYYLASSRDIKRLEGTTRSPVFSHLSATLQGLVTIRAFGVQENFTRKFDRHQNHHTQTWFLFLTTSRWFGIMLDWMSITFLSVVALSCIVSADLFELNSSVVGLSLSYCIMLMGAFQWGVRQSAEVENLMTSTERVLEYTKLKPEAPLETDKRPPADWPKHGIITFEGVSVSYSDNGPLVLKGLNCCIRAQEKVGIVGRTGAGKSSLMAALMRLMEPRGIVKIDGVDVSEIGLHDLRKYISFIPQDPVLFSGTLRKNLDPFNQHTDDEMWNALEEVQLKTIIDESPEKLELAMMEGGSNFSVGQRQLVCLARAVLHKNKILIVDEATANVDLKTDQLIQLTIRKKFQHCTVMTIAHRLNTIMDSDRVMVLDQGRIVEFDEPFVLLQKENSHLSLMVDETGRSEASKLFAVARSKYVEMNPSNPYNFNMKDSYHSRLE